MRKKEVADVAKKQLKRFVVIVALAGMVANLTYRKTNHIGSDRLVLRTDSEGYYQYLPHFFIQDWDRMDKMHWAIDYNGKMLNVYTCGVAIMQMPFFLMAHVISYFADLETTGNTQVYYLSIFFASLFYVLIGLLLLYQFLRRFINHKSALWSVVLLFFATNLFYYTNLTSGMAHAYSFCLVATLVYFTPRFYENTGVKNLLYVAFPLGLATLLRPTNLLIVIFFFLYEVSTWEAFKKRLLFWLKHWYYLLIMLLVGLLVFVPQMLYWHHITGKYIFYSYVGGGFPYWKNPQIFTVLLGPRNGWFVYTPLMLFSVSGLVYLLYKRKFSALAITIIMVLIIYINSSWWCPTFSGAAGYRALIGYLPFMALPLGYVIHQNELKKNKMLWRAMISVFCLFIVYNILFSYKYSPWLWWNTDWQWSYLLRLFKF